MANIVPIFKKGNRNLASNYRPISLTSTCCKVMEHIIFHFIMNHLVMYNIINNHQHSFRPAHSCQSQLILLTKDMLRAMDVQKQVDLILLDFCKAFDKVPHQRLLTKLKYYGIQGNLLNWITECMIKRQQRVDNKVSDFLPVKSGIPQGTALGPLMFLLYINDIDQTLAPPLDCLLTTALCTE